MERQPSESSISVVGIGFMEPVILCRNSHSRQGRIAEPRTVSDGPPSKRGRAGFQFRGLVLVGAVLTLSLPAFWLARKIALPGIGTMAIQSIFNLDVPMIMGTVLFSSTVVVLGKRIVDGPEVGVDPASSPPTDSLFHGRSPPRNSRSPDRLPGR